MSEIQLEAVVREKLGGTNTKHYRLEGKLPGVVYGPQMDTIPVLVSHKALIKLYHGSKLQKNTVIRLNIVKDKKTESMDVISCQYEYDPLTNRINHVDFLKITPETTLVIEIPITIEGVAPGVKMGGLLVKGRDSLKIQCHPNQIPVSISVDISKMNIGDALRIRDLPENQNYTVLSPQEQVLVKVQGARAADKEEEASVATGTAQQPVPPAADAVPSQENHK